VTALTLGAVRDVTKWRDSEIGIGGDVTGYAVPAAARTAYGDHPISFHLFVRVRPPSGPPPPLSSSHSPPRRRA